MYYVPEVILTLANATVICGFIQPSSQKQRAPGGSEPHTTLSAGQRWWQKLFALESDAFFSSILQKHWTSKYF